MNPAGASSENGILQPDGELGQHLRGRQIIRKIHPRSLAPQPTATSGEPALTDVFSLIERASAAINEADARTLEVQETARDIAARVRQEVRNMKEESVLNSERLAASYARIHELEEERRSAEERALLAERAALSVQNRLSALEQAVEDSFGVLSDAPTSGSHRAPLV